MRDPTKPVGYRFLNNAPADGAKVWVTVSIYDHGKLHWTKRYFSNYPAVNGVTRRGDRLGLSQSLHDGGEVAEPRLVEPADEKRVDSPALPCSDEFVDQVRNRPDE